MEQQKKKKSLFHRKKNKRQNSHKSTQESRNAKNTTLITANKQHQEKDVRVNRSSFPEGALPDIARPALSDIQRSVRDKITSLPRIYTDMYDEHTQQVVSFEEALELVKKKEELEEGESLIYAGAGSFAVVKTEGTGKEKTQVVVRKIEFEKRHEENNWREEMHFGVHSVFIPKPSPLSELYTDEDIAEFKIK